jgi:predicted amidohydrolase
MNIGSTHAMSGKFEVEALSVVVCQIQPFSARTMEDVNRNVDQLLDFMDKASSGFPGYDLIVTPECALQGYDPEYWSGVMVEKDGPEVQRLKDKCKELDVWGVFNPWVKQPDKQAPLNWAIIVDNHGEIVYEYVKVNPWIPGEPTYPGSGQSVVAGPKGSKLAVITCADGDYPEAWREAAFLGANVILRIAHYMAPWDRAWEITNKAGAYCNQCYVVASNSAGLDESFGYFGKSMILNPDGTIITEAPMGIPWMIKADLYPAIIDEMRRQAVTNNFLYSFKRRGASCEDYRGLGDTQCPYQAYADWSRDSVLP